MLQSVAECYRVLLSVTECYKVLQSVTGCYRILQRITEYYKDKSSASTWTNFWACYLCPAFLFILTFPVGDICAPPLSGIYILLLHYLLIFVTI